MIMPLFPARSTMQTRYRAVVDMYELPEPRQVITFNSFYSLNVTLLPTHRPGSLV